MFFSLSSQVLKCVGVIAFAWPLTLCADAVLTSSSHCKANELTVFSCRIDAKVVSICAEHQGSDIVSLDYRFGALDRVELEYVANSSNNNRFFATVSPVSPRASVRQVWFMRGKFKYLVTECMGGDCPQAGGLTVFRSDKLLSAQSCQRTGDDHAWFSSEIVKFGSEPDNSQSLSNLLQFDNIDNSVELIYPLPIRY